ncbi:MAG: hypothetical protein L6Q98_16265 [Anaerolineae bacterium]|nr:hypothetical protein [Anaerolineae bacterium]NUQ04233.1 hypothetical protein [Anaerolineae bacterium]
MPTNRGSPQTEFGYTGEPLDGNGLIHLRAARPLPDSGIASDGSHLHTQPGRFCDFDGGERRYGGTLRNLLTLQALDLLRLALNGTSRTEIETASSV